MAYTALYRKFRPVEFEDVKGQEHIVTTLKNQIKARRIGHAYLFCGTRGTGKTSVAKIFARAVNCQNPVEGSPCGECAVCRAIQAGNSMNVIEIDAASNNGVDNIREIREEVTYSPTEGNYKVYIIDEVHMLSIGAFNALLKTLEEPPSYVIFILATTEAHKIPITILSRCQRYDFHRITIDTIADRLMELVAEEQVEAEEKAIRYIAKAGDGSLRDAISLLDRCISFYLGQTLTYDNVLDVLGAVDTEVFGRMLRKVIQRDVAGVMGLLQDLMIQGREPGQLVTDFTWYLRNLLLLQTSEDMEDVLDISSDNLALLKEEARLVSPELLMRYIRVFSELSNQIRYGTQKRILIEVALIKLCRPEMEENVDALLARISRLEKLAEEGALAAVPLEKSSGGFTFEGREALAEVLEGGRKKAESPGNRPKALPEDVQQVVNQWRSILQDLPGSLRTFLKPGSAHLSLGGDNVLLVVFEDEFAQEYMNREEHRQELLSAITNHTGKEIELKMIKNETNRPFSETYVDLEQVINMEIEIEE